MSKKTNIPPPTVWVKVGLCSADSLINILLCVLGYLPGLLHAWYIIAKYPEPAYEYEALPQDREGGRVTYVYVQSPQNNQSGRSGRQQQKKLQGQQQQQQQPNYGTQGAQGGSQPAQKPQQEQPSGPQPQEQGVTTNGEGSSGNQGVPPSYAEVVAGDHKVQSQD